MPESQGFTSTQPQASWPDDAPRRTGHGEKPGDAIGPYHLMEVLGQGGFGTVWLAERREPFVQRAALKIIKPGMDSAAVIARFEQERQALALMDHPNVAKVLDGGVTPPEMGSRPYFVMEHVSGRPITEYCDHRRLTVRERLELFIAVCEAVQHAHMKGIIHRDLKPSNILVAGVESGAGTTGPGAPPPAPGTRWASLSGAHGAPGTDHGVTVGVRCGALVKVIDFGIAKAIAREAEGATAFTEAGQFIGTPDFLSPEQAALNPAEVDTRTDVYSLGLVLYELLTGTLPPERIAARSRSFDAFLRELREREPSRPSSAVSAGGPGAEAAAAARRTTGAALARELKRELEWIPLKALRVERRRRYQTAAELADDLRRYLAGEALAAGPESRAYRARKFGARHRLGLVAGATVALALIAGAAVAVVFGLSEGIQRRESDAIRAFMFQDVFGAADPTLPAKQRFLRAVELASSRVESGELAKDPEVELGVRLTIGGVLINLGRIAGAEPILTKALESIRERRLGDRADLGTALHRLAQVRRDQGRFDEGALLARQAVEIRRAGESPLDLADSLTVLGSATRGQGDLAGAERIHLEALGLRTAAKGAGAIPAAESQSELARVYLEAGRAAEAERLLTTALQSLTGALGPDHGYPAMVSMNLALLHLNNDELERAAALAERTLAANRVELGDAHPDVATMLASLAAIRQEQGRHADAARALEDALTIQRAALGAREPVIADTLIALARARAALGDPEASMALLGEALETQRGALGDRHPALARTLHLLARQQSAAGLHAQALRHMQECESIRRAVSPGSSDHAAALFDLGYVKLVAGDARGAEVPLRESLGIYGGAGRGDEESRARALVGLGMSLMAQDRAADAEAPLREALLLRERLVGGGSWQTANVRSLLGGCLAGLGRAEDAEPLLARAAQDIAADPGAPPARMRESVQRLVEFLDSHGRGAEAEPWRALLGSR